MAGGGRAAPPRRGGWRPSTHRLPAGRLVHAAVGRSAGHRRRARVQAMSGCRPPPPPLVAPRSDQAQPPTAEGGGNVPKFHRSAPPSTAARRDVGGDHPLAGASRSTSTHRRGGGQTPASANTHPLLGRGGEWHGGWAGAGRERGRTAGRGASPCLARRCRDERGDSGQAPVPEGLAVRTGEASKSNSNFKPSLSRGPICYILVSPDNCRLSVLFE